MPVAAVLGTGLIGASIAIGLRGSGWQVQGWDPDRSAGRGALDMGALDVLTQEREAAVEAAELVVLAGPVTAIIEGVSQLETEALVTDVAGVKLPVVAASSLRHFVGGHPMAGRETAGPAGASGSMFRGATWVLVSDGAEARDIERMKDIVKGLGAIPVVMTAGDHDRTVGLVSHLPHLAAAALVRTVGRDPEAMELVAGGFRDLTRIAMSDPGWWVDVLVANRDSVSEAARGLARELENLAALVEGGRLAELESMLAESRRVRTSMSAPVATVSVVVEDRPGEIARVGHSLAESGVDLRDLQLRHATHGGGGVLTLSVRAGEEERLRRALEADGFRLVDRS